MQGPQRGGRGEGRGTRRVVQGWREGMGCVGRVGVVELVEKGCGWLRVVCGDRGGLGGEGEGGLRGVGVWVGVLVPGVCVGGGVGGGGVGWGGGRVARAWGLEVT